MKHIKAITLVIMICTFAVPNSGCWDYREIEKLSIVTGIAIDKDGSAGKYTITVEIIDVKPGGKEVETVTKLLSIEDDTIFEAVRNLVKVTGERLYWGHARSIIISPSVANEGILSVIDFLSRDVETRSSMLLFISDVETARDIFQAKDVPYNNVSYFLSEMEKAKESISEYPITTINTFVTDITEEGLEPLLPVVSAEDNNGKKIPSAIGSSIFKKDKPIGSMNGNDTKYALFIKNEINGGVIVHNIKNGEKMQEMTMEIYKNKTKLIPRYIKGNIEMEIQINTELAVGEVAGVAEFSTEEGQNRLKNSIEKEIERNCGEIVRKVQKEYGSDMFGFGNAVKVKMPDIWRRIEPDWDMRFRDIKVSVDANVEIKNSALLSKPLHTISR